MKFLNMDFLSIQCICIFISIVRSASFGAVQGIAEGLSKGNHMMDMSGLLIYFTIAETFYSQKYEDKHNNYEGKHGVHILDVSPFFVIDWVMNDYTESVTDSMDKFKNGVMVTGAINLGPEEVEYGRRGRNTIVFELNLALILDVNPLLDLVDACESVKFSANFETKDEYLTGHTFLVNQEFEVKPHSAPLLRYASAGKIAEAEFQQEVSVIVQLKNEQSVTLPWKTIPMHVTTLKVDKMSAIPVNLPDFWKPFFMADGTSNFVLKVMKPTEQSRSAFYCERGAWKFEGPEFLGEKHRHISISTCKRYISIVGEHNGKTLEPMLFQSTINSNRELKETRLSVYTLQGQMRPMLLPRIKWKGFEENELYQIHLQTETEKFLLLQVVGANHHKKVKNDLLQLLDLFEDVVVHMHKLDDCTASIAWLDQNSDTIELPVDIKHKIQKLIELLNIRSDVVFTDFDFDTNAYELHGFGKKFVWNELDKKLISAQFRQVARLWFEKWCNATGRGSQTSSNSESALEVGQNVTVGLDYGVENYE